MTLVLAIACKDGVVIAADSATTDEGLKQPSEKIKRLSDLPVLYGGSGDVGLMQKIDESLSAAVMRPTLQVMRREIKKRVGPELRESTSLHAAYPTVENQLPPIAVILFVGILDGKPWILEIEKDNRDTIYGDSLGNFAAIGSGKMLAQALFRPHLTTERDLRAGKIFAYRILEDAIDLSAAYLAKPIHIHTIALDGTIEKVSSSELEAIETTCEGWRELERGTVGQVLAGHTEEDGAEIPKPGV